jgi:hypothetical protein
VLPVWAEALLLFVAVAGSVRAWQLWGRERRLAAGLQARGEPALAARELPGADARPDSHEQEQGLRPDRQHGRSV